MEFGGEIRASLWTNSFSDSFARRASIHRRLIPGIPGTCLGRSVRVEAGMGRLLGRSFPHGPHDLA